MEAASETISSSSVPQAAFWLHALGDNALTKLAAAGSDEAFTIIYQRFQGRVYAYCVSILQDSSEAEDALHEVMFNTHQTLRESERDIAIKPWLFRCARNYCLNLIQRRAVRDDALHELKQESELTESQFERQEELRQVLRDVSRLPDEQKQALIMREAAGLSHVAIAEALEIDTAKAKRLLFEARRSMHAGVEGREMACAEVRCELSEGDGRTWRRRDLRSHLRACSACEEFKQSLGRRRAVLGAGLPLLGPEAAIAVLAKVFSTASTAEAAVAGAGTAGAAGAGVAGAGAASAAGGAGTSGTAAGLTGVAAKLAGTGVVVQKGVAVIAVSTVVAAGGYTANKEVSNLSRSPSDAVTARATAKDGGDGATLTAANGIGDLSQAVQRFKGSGDKGKGGYERSGGDIDDLEGRGLGNESSFADWGSTNRGLRGSRRGPRGDRRGRESHGDRNDGDRNGGSEGKPNGKKKPGGDDQPVDNQPPGDPIDPVSPPPTSPQPPSDDTPPDEGSDEDIIDNPGENSGDGDGRSGDGSTESR